MDALEQQAREAHRLSIQHTDQAEHFRRQRDDLVRELYGRGGYSYGNLAKQVGCSPQLIAKIVQGRC
jgi:ribosome-binding protein aMBF1 (putative translation factor)